MSILDQISTPPPDQAEVIVNENGVALEHQAVYGKRSSTSNGLTWGYYGGRWGGFSVSTSTLTLTASSDNYVVVAIADGTISVSTASTNWDNDTDYVRVYKITTGTSTVSGVEDHRAGPGGVHGGGGGGSGGGDASTNTATSVDSEVALFSGTTGKILKRATGSGYPKLTSGVQSVQTAAQLATDLGTNVKSLEHIAIACSDETTAVTTGTAKATFRMPYAFTLTAVRASVTTAPTGSTLVIDINESGTTVLSTKLSIDASEKTSTTAATPAVISDASLADDAEITIDFDQVGSTIAGAGVKVYLIGTRT
jgi:hypothetical protein